MNRKKVSLIAVLPAIVVLLAVAVQPGVAALPDYEQSGAPSGTIPGVVFTGKYINIGLNKGGTFGSGTAAAGVGFQYPIGKQNECLAYAWWGEGYLLAYRVWNSATSTWENRVAFWWPDLGYPPPAMSRIKPVSASISRNDVNQAEYNVKVQTIDAYFNMTFTFVFPKDQKYVTLRTVVTKNVAVAVRDVVYKRIVDWDIHQNTVNYWTSDADAAYASYYNATTALWYDLSTAGYTAASLNTMVSYVDLYAWDDYTTRESGPARYSIQSHTVPLRGDGCTAIYYDLRSFTGAKGEARTVMTVYQAGEHKAPPGLTDFGTAP